MEFKIVWTDRALDELREVCRYISNGSESAAERVGDDILRHVEILRDFPFIGPPFPRGESGRVREILCRGYRIFYRVNEGQSIVEILTIWHSAREPPMIDD